MGYETFRSGALRFLQHYFTVSRPNKLVVVVALYDFNLCFMTYNRRFRLADHRREILSPLRDGPLEDLRGRGEFSSRRNFFLLSNSLYVFFLGHSMNIFLGLIGVHVFFFHLIFPCANIFLFFAPPPPSHEFSNGPSLRF